MSRYYYIFTLAKRPEGKQFVQAMIRIDTKRIKVAEAIMGLECSTSKELEKFYATTDCKEVRYHRDKQREVAQMKASGYTLLAVESAKKMGLPAISAIVADWSPDQTASYKYKY